MNVELFGPTKLTKTWFGSTPVWASKFVGTPKFLPSTTNSIVLYWAASVGVDCKKSFVTSNWPAAFGVKP